MKYRNLTSTANNDEIILFTFSHFWLPNVKNFGCYLKICLPNNSHIYNSLKKLKNVESNFENFVPKLQNKSLKEFRKYFAITTSYFNHIFSLMMLHIYICCAYFLYPHVYKMCIKFAVFVKPSA